MKKLFFFVCLTMLCASAAWSADFINGGFEDGTFNGWTAGSGYWYGGWPINPQNYQVGGPNYNPSANASAIVTPGNDPVVGNRLNRVYSGNYAARVNDWVNNYSVSTIEQTVANWSGTGIFFAWAAVLEASHGATDSDNFTLRLADVTTGTDVYNVSYNSYTNGPIFKYYNGWYYTDWQIESLTNLTPGDTYQLQLLASDCPYGGHAGYVYLDGFGAAPPDPGTVPEPGTMLLMGLGVAGAAFLRMRMMKKA